MSASVAMPTSSLRTGANPVNEAALKDLIVHEEKAAEVADNKAYTTPKSPEQHPQCAYRTAAEMAAEIPPRTLWTTATSAFTLILFYFFAVLRDFYRKIVPRKDNYARPGYARVVKDFDDYWNRRFYRRIRDCFCRIIDSRPSRVIGVMERVSNDYNTTFQYTGRILPVVNLGSYNYLGFAEDTPSITHDVFDSLDDFGLASCSAPQELGQNSVVARLEKEMAKFLGKEDAIVCGMGFGTNFRGLPALFGKEALVVSDSLNHSSLVNGVRSAGAKVKVYKHDNFAQLEEILREAVILGQDPYGAYKPYKRIVIIVEGVYSMEGEIVDLARIVELKKKYNAFLFVDEAHSIGAIGATGRGVCEHCGVDPKDVEVLMGTFTKSFGSVGGYIATDKSVVDFLRLHSTLALHCDSMAPACAQQALSVLGVILGKDGTDLGQKRIRQLKDNSAFFRRGLMDLGFVVLGDDSSPVIPVMCYNLGKLSVLARKCLERGVAIVVVGYPATPLLEGRIRFCVSAAHTREDLQHTLDVMKEMARHVHLTFNKKAIKH